MSGGRWSGLELPLSGLKARRVFRRRRRQNRLKLFATGLLLLLSGAGTLAALMQLPERLDTLLLVSNAIANLIGGLARFGMGLLQMVAVVALVALVLAALVLLVAGSVRLVKALLPAPSHPSDS